MGKFRKNDLILIAVIICVGAIFALIVFWRSEKGEFVQVRVDGEIVLNLSLNIDDMITIEGFSGGMNELTIKDGEAYMSDASCPDRLCMHMGKIKVSGQSIVCLPNKVTVEVVSESGNGPKIDGVVK